MELRTVKDFELVQLLKKTMLYNLWLAIRDGKQYCLKVYRKKELVEHGLSNKVKKEAILMSSLDSPFICQL